ncbi:MAG: protein phosphatase 2C domain-containing protein [Gammaproteobacteria bacterium]
MQYLISRTSRLGNRETNQDRLVALEHEGAVLLVVADGLGGKKGGALAAQSLIDTATDIFTATRLPVTQSGALLTEILVAAHHNIKKVGAEQDPPLTPGTTGVLCLVQEGRAQWAHVGDSRLYLFRDGLPLYRTQDHSYVEQLYQEGQISLDNIQGHPMRNYVTRCLGLTDGDPEVTLSNEVQMKTGDILLLCTDGLWDPVDDAQLGAIIVHGRLSDALNQMAERAEQVSYPASDNITALAFQLMSLRLTSKTVEAEKSEPHKVADPLDSAIGEIERAIEQYGGEMDDGHT